MVPDGEELASFQLDGLKALVGKAKKEVQEQPRDLIVLQSGVSWNYHTHMIDVDPHLWRNLIILAGTSTDI